MDMGFASFLLQCGSLIALIMSYTGILIDNNLVKRIGQVIGVLDLIACILFLIFYS